MIGYVGLSHLGINTSIAVASKGFDVIGYDPDENLCRNMTDGKLPIFEPDLDDLLKKSKEKIKFTSNEAELKKCKLIVISTDIKTDENNRSDLSTLMMLFNKTLNIASNDTVLVILSQVHPGFTRKLYSEVEETLKKKNIQLYYQVETLIFGRAVERALYPERFIVGCKNPGEPIPPAFREMLESFGCPILPMRYESAELAKISINCCLVSSVSTANTLAEICEKIGADWSEIVPALRLDKRIGQYAYLEPGLGIAGGNLERDLITITNLSNEYGTDSGVVHAWIANSAYRKDWVLRKLQEVVLPLHDEPIIAVWGLAYKINTKSLKNSPSIELLKNIQNIDVQAYDPQAIVEQSEFPKVKQVESALKACKGANALVIMTPWAEFKDINLAEFKKSLKGNVIIDPYKTINEQECKKLGFDYYCLGKTMER